MDNISDKRAVRFLGWRMVALASLCINIGMGFTFGAYSTLMPSIIAEFSASHALASGGLSLMVAITGFCAPVASYAVRRWSIRATLIAGCVFMSAGWGVMGVAANAWQFIFGFGILCGVALACLFPVPPMTLINNWFIAFRGRAVGIAVITLLPMVVPSLAAVAITTLGWRTTALIISAVALLLSPLMLFVIDRPESIGQVALGKDSVSGGDPQAEVVNIAPGTAFLADPVFWVVLLGMGFCSAAGVALATHLVSFALERGFDLGRAASLVSIFGGAALVGSLVSGFMVDRIGGARAFAVIAFAQFIAWPFLLLPRGYYVLASCVAVIGLCSNSITPAAMTLIANVFGRERFARAMGLLTVCTTPFSIVLPLVAGALYDFSGSYSQVFMIYAALFGIAGTAFCFLSRIEAHRQATASLPAVALGS